MTKTRQLTKMTAQELAIWQRLERLKDEAAARQNEASARGAWGIQANPSAEVQATQDYWYERGKVEAALEILAFMKFGE